jgi:hypothetical protein
MKQNSTQRNICLIGVALLLSFGLIRCSLTKMNYCGYNGPVVSQQAINLYARDHFIPKKTIDDWTARYEANKALIKNDSSKVNNNLLGDKCSFNGRYVKLLVLNENSIGLRVLYGMDPNFGVHIILVGIKPDYSTLYIPRPGPVSMEEDTDTPTSSHHETGGLQFSQRP